MFGVRVCSQTIKRKYDKFLISRIILFCFFFCFVLFGEIGINSLSYCCPSLVVHLLQYLFQSHHVQVDYSMVEFHLCQRIGMPMNRICMSRPKFQIQFAIGRTFATF